MQLKVPVPEPRCRAWSDSLLLLWLGGETISSIFLKIGDRLDAQVFWGVVLYDKNGNIFKSFKTEFLTPVPGVWKNGRPNYMAKNENHASVLFDSLNEAFWCTDHNVKNLSSLQSPISEKNHKKTIKSGPF